MVSKRLFETPNHKALRKARPNLRLIQPVIWWTTNVLGIFNILLGLIMLLGFGDEISYYSLLIVNNFLPFTVWGIVFLLLGLLMLFANLTNRWWLNRNIMFIGVLIKSTWAITMLVRPILFSGTILVAILWTALALIQAICYVFFAVVPREDKR